MSEKLFSVAKTELEANETAARELYESARRDFEAVALDEFERNGGCRFCRGEGGDMVGYHDGDSVWERCRQCGGRDRYDDWDAPRFRLESCDLYERTLGDLDRALAAAVEENRSLANRALEDGDRVRVVRGRRVKIDTEGTVTRVSSSRFGGRTHTSVCLDGVTWVDARNCERLVGGARARVARAGDVVTTKGNITGKVFWTRGIRVGLRVDSLADPVWTTTMDLVE